MLSTSDHAFGRKQRPRRVKARSLLSASALESFRALLPFTPGTMTAADNGHLEVVKALVERGADVDVLDHDNWSPRQVSTRLTRFLVLSITEGRKTFRTCGVLNSLAFSDKVEVQLLQTPPPIGVSMSGHGGE